MTEKKIKARPFALTCNEPSKTQQHFKDDVNVNNIVARYAQTGLDPYADRRRNQHFGFATSKDFTEAQNEVASVRSSFNELPARERAKFDNDPASWLDHLMAPPDPTPDDAKIVDSGPPQKPPKGAPEVDKNPD